MKKTLTQIHEDVPPDHYDKGYKHNRWQKIWHSRRIYELKKLTPNPHGVIADIGCHSGFLTSRVLQNISSNKIYGIDVSKSAIQLARQRIRNGIFTVGDAHKLPYKNNFFDFVYCLEMLEHVENPEKIIKEIKRVVKKNGEIIIMVPTDNTLFRIIWMLWNRVYPVWNHTHIQSFKSDRLLNLLEKNGLKIDVVKKFNLNMLLLIKASKRS